MPLELQATVSQLVTSSCLLCQLAASAPLLLWQLFAITPFVLHWFFLLHLYVCRYVTTARSVQQVLCFTCHKCALHNFLSCKHDFVVITCATVAIATSAATCLLSFSVPLPAYWRLSVHFLVGNTLLWCPLAVA